MTNKSGYSARNESIKLGILLVTLCLVLIYGDWLWRWDRLIYDVQSSLIRHATSDDIVIIAIDENSLQTLGRWPWPRNIHAQLINQLTEVGSRAILLDMILAEPSTDENDDIQLAEAIEKNGKVVLPVLMEQVRLRGQLIETLPLPRLTTAADQLGHVHVELDPDGIARGTYLYEGLGEPRWPHISVALLQSLGLETATGMKQEAESLVDSTWTWVRQHPFMIPFAGPPGAFTRVSYIDVLSDNQLASSLKDKIILIGVTAAGLGDSLPTPVSGLSQPMPGIEINANILQAIMDDRLIQQTGRFTLYLLSALLVLLPISLFPYLSPRMSLLLISTEIIGVFVMSLILLHVFTVWLPMSAILICLILAYPLWAWRRLEFTVKYLNEELDTLNQQARSIKRYVAQDAAMPFESFQDLVPVSGINVFNVSNEAVLQLGKKTNRCPGKIVTHEWRLLSENTYGLKLLIGTSYYRVCIQWRFEKAPDDYQTRAIKTYVRFSVKPQHEAAKSTVEVIESRIREIRDTTDKLASLRQFVTDSLEQMADGIVVIDSLGNITLANKQATKLFSSISGDNLLHQSIMPILNRLETAGGETWPEVIQDILSSKCYENLQVSTENDRDLIINISPLHTTGNTIAGFIINLSDITELKDAQRKRNEMLSFLSHDLRSPLVSVLALLDQSKLDNNISSVSERIEKNINHTIELAEDFVHLSRMEGEEHIKFDSVNMADIILNAIDTIWDQAQLHQTSIQQDLAEDCWVRANGSVLERVMVNLLTNAIKYSDASSTISIHLNKDKNRIHCNIEDTGYGIEEDQLPYLFDRFKRVRNSGSATGIGLGLAFVKAAILRHHGNVTVTSQVGKGSCFSIVLPADSE